MPCTTLTIEIATPSLPQVTNQVTATSSPVIHSTNLNLLVRVHRRGMSLPAIRFIAFHSVVLFACPRLCSYVPVPSQDFPFFLCGPVPPPRFVFLCRVSNLSVSSARGSPFDSKVTIVLVITKLISFLETQT